MTEMTAYVFQSSRRVPQLQITLDKLYFTHSDNKLNPTRNTDTDIPYSHSLVHFIR